MILIACIDDGMGLAFNHRRQSRDSAVCSDIAALVGTVPLWLSERSAPLFEGLGLDILTADEPAFCAGEGEYCFLEFSSPAAFAGSIEKLVLYRWNRSYPSDVKFDISLEDWAIDSALDFPGSSHERITREVYTRV